MIVGVDASHIKVGGSITHLKNLVEAADLAAHEVSEIRIWGNRKTLARLPDLPGISRLHEPFLDRSIPWRLYWQVARLPALARECDALLVTGGSTFYRYRPVVSMCRNMLPFDWSELVRYRVSLTSLRLLVLRLVMGVSFHRADGVIFLTEYARQQVGRVARPRGLVSIVPHGVEERFRQRPRPQRPSEALTEDAPLRLLYVSIIDEYKHQWHVAEAVARLRARGVPVIIQFVGPAYPPALEKFERVRRRLDPEAAFLIYEGPVPHDRLHELWSSADCFVFASSCENMPNILIEGMAGGFPIACSRCGPMPEILGDGGVFFDPTEPAEIESALESLARDPELRSRCAKRAYERAMAFSWDRCARETLDFVAEVAREYATSAGAPS